MLSRHPSLLNRDDTLLLVIEMQEPFLRDIPDREALIRKVRLLLSAAGVLKVPMVASVQYRDRMGAFVPEVAQRLPDNCDPIDKLCFSCGGSDDLMKAIAEYGRRQIVLCGVETHICVCQTALDLVSMGYQPQVAEDGVSARSPRMHAIGIERMRGCGVTISCAESAIYELLVEASNPTFKEIVGLVKAAAADSGTTGSRNPAKPPPVPSAAPSITHEVRQPD